MRALVVLLTITFSLSYFVSDAYAYIDGGSGSILIQVIVGALVGVGITLKIYWYQFKEKMQKLITKNRN